MNVKLTFFCISYLLFFSMESTFCQSLVFDWVKTSEGPHQEQSEAIILDSYGNIYTVGTFNDTADFDPGPAVFNLTSPGTYDADIFIQKLDNNGNFLWAKSIGGIGNDGFLCLAIDSSNTIYITGHFSDSIDLDPSSAVFNLISSGQFENFILTLDDNGNFLDVKSIENTDYLRINDIDISPSGYLYLTGTFLGLTDFELGPAIDTINATNNSLYLAKYTLNGDLLWVNSFQGFGSSISDFIALDYLENIYLTGNHSIKKLDSSGVLLWEINYTSDLVWTDIDTDTSNNLYLCGYFTTWGTTDVDPTSTVFNVYNISPSNGLIVKLSSLGEFQWAQSLGSGGTDKYFTVSVSEDGLILLTGNYQGSPDFNPGPAINELQQANLRFIFLQSLSLDGNFISARSITDNSGVVGADLELDEFGNAYLTGWHQGFADFDPSANTYSINAGPFSNMFVEKFNNCTPIQSVESLSECDSYEWINGITYTTNNYIDTFIVLAGSSNGCDSIVLLNLDIHQSNWSIDSVSECISYTWMNGNTYTQSTSSPTWILTNADGCDSIVTLHLTINPVDIGISPINDTTLYSNATGATTYQWFHCENGLIPINGETSQYFYPSMNGNYAVEVTENGCIDTSGCQTIETIGLIENDFGNSLIVCPNPSSGKIRISLMEELSSVCVKVINIEGKLISKYSFNQTNEIELFLMGDDGFYILEITIDDKTSRVKILKH